MRALTQVVLILAVCGFSVAQDKPLAYMDPSLPAATRAHDLVSRMTLDEKASQLEDWAVAIPRLGVPDYQTWSEALHGVARSGYATVFPQAIGMAATWDPAMVQQMGDVIAQEARAKFNQAQREGNHRIFYGLTFWSPNINIFRDPRWGRGQETYGEDPFLTATMGNAFITGVQGADPDHPKAVATSKHFAVHSGPESMRHGFNVDVSPRDLEETYLPAFRSTVVDGHVKSVMCAYNAIDGIAACANKMLLKEHLREAWGFKGFVVSDCGAIVDVFNGHHNAPDILGASVISLQAGTDLSCSIWAPGFNTLADAVRKGAVSESLVTQAAERLFTARMKLGMFDPLGANTNDRIPFSANASEQNRKTALRAAEESMVLLKNDRTLPLRKAPANIAVIGPTADLVVALEGNYNGTPLQPITPLDGITRQFAASKIHYAQGSTLADGVSVPVSRTAFGSGLKTEYYAGAVCAGRPVAVGTDPEIQRNWGESVPVPEIHTHDYCVRWTGKLSVPVIGRYTFEVEPGDSGFPWSPRESYRFVLDGKVLTEGELNSGKADLTRKNGASPSAPGHNPDTKTANIEFTFTDTNPHEITLEYSHSIDHAGGGVNLRWNAPADAQLSEAVSAAKASDIVLAFVGLSPQLEGEEMSIKIPGFTGGDRTSIDLPAPQQRLLEAIAGSGRPIVVISMSGSALALTWAKDHATAIVQAWYPGVEGGTAIAHTLAGENNPAGRLPVTFYSGVSDLPAFTEYSMKDRTYRYYQGKPLWGFGYGLSYSNFEYQAVRLSPTHLQAGQPLTATISITNTSNIAGDEVVEAYVKTPQPGGPVHSLAGLKRVHLNPGESCEVSIELSARALSSVDDKGNRSIIPGTYHLSLGSTQPGETKTKSKADFDVSGTAKLPR